VQIGRGPATVIGEPDPSRLEREVGVPPATMPRRAWEGEGFGRRPESQEACPGTFPKLFDGKSLGIRLGLPKAPQATVGG